MYSLTNYITDKGQPFEYGIGKSKFGKLIQQNPRSPIVKEYIVVMVPSHF